MVYPRFLARAWAWLAGYFWLPCPSCKKHFAGFEASMGPGVVVDGKDFCVCLDCGTGHQIEG